MDLLRASHIAPPNGDGKVTEEALQGLGSVFSEPQAPDIAIVAQQFIDAIAKHRDWSRLSAALIAPVPA